MAILSVFFPILDHSDLYFLLPPENPENSSFNEELELIEIMTRQQICQRVLMADRVLQLFFTMIRRVEEQLERTVTSHQAFDGNGGVVGEY